MYSKHALLSFAVRAATIDERLSDSFEELPGSKEDCDASSRRLAAWCRHAASGSWTEFVRRLHRDSKSLDAILPRLSRISLRKDVAWFDWLKDSQWIAKALVDDPPPDHIKRPRRYEELPFEDLFQGLIYRATERRDELIDRDTLREIPNRILAALTHDLLKSVTSLCEEILYELFRRFYAVEERSNREICREGSSTIYGAYIAQLRAGGLFDIFNTYPVLLRLIASWTRQWIDTSAELLCRLKNDIPVIREQFVPGATLTEISNVETGVSDIHDFGRSVCIITFSDSCSVVYKPRGVLIDKRWNDLIHWLNSCKPPFDLYTCKVIPRNGYGWCEYIEHCDAEDKKGLTSFFNRAGALLALCYLFNGKDMHDENLIAAGDHPVLIDLEMLFQPSAARGLANCRSWQAQNMANARIARSVLATGLIPTWLPTPNARAVVVGGLHARSVEGLRLRVWRDINSDQMAPIWMDRTAPLPTNLPGLRQESVSLEKYAGEVLEGCEKYLRFLLSKKSELLSATDSFHGAQIRRLLKPTQFYDLLINRLRDYRNMSDGAEWSANLEFLSRFASWGEEDDTSWALTSAERDQLSYLNIPYFCQWIDQHYTQDRLGSVSASTDSSPMEDVRQTIRDFDDEELERQLRFLRVSLSALKDNSTNGFDRQSGTLLSNDSSVFPPLSRALALSVADGIAIRLREIAIRKDGGAAWTGLRPMADDLGWQFSVLGSDLYCGTPGIALFFAAHSKLTNNREWLDLALAALAPWRYILRSSNAAHFARLNGIGGVVGMGSLVYALSTISEILDEPDIHDDALVASTLITNDLINSDETFDVIGGAAGAILGLLKLYRISRSAAVLERALTCGQHLLQRRPSRDKRFGMWPQPNGVPLTGFSHGAAGFAYALSSLASATGELVFSEAAQDCLLYEQAMYSFEHRNWRDLRYSEGDLASTYCCQWCHGAGGIALARISMLRLGGSGRAILDDIEAAVGTVRRTMISDVDTLCCGNMGRVETLIEAAALLGRAELAEEARCKAQAIIDRAKARGGFGWILGGDIENLGFFGGLAGLGYSFLRCIYPERIPCILMLE